MRCPTCGADRTRVIDSRPVDRASSIRRRRRCTNCDHRFTTYERLAAVRVTKRSGRKEAFDPGKIRSGLDRALADRVLPAKTVDEVVRRVEDRVSAKGEATSDEIGDWVLDELRQIDEVAYLRFASVYKEFQQARDFEAEMASLED